MYCGDEAKMVIDKKGSMVRLYVEKDLKVVLGVCMAAVVKKCLESGSAYIPDEIAMMEMIVGAGKTFFITWACRKGDIILTDRRITVGEIVKDVNSRGISPAEVPVCTGSSYLINREQQYERVFIDEASMMHWGFIVTLIQLIRPKVVILCGDKKQIGYTDEY
jgi:hypothetical protein